MSVLLKEYRGSIALFRLNRPEIGNALNEELIKALNEQLKVESQRKDLSAIVLTGHGPKFCTGADLNEMREKKGKFGEGLNLFFETLRILQTAPLLTASFVNGDCFGGGLGLALSTDYILAKDSARFGTPEITKGIFPFLISSFLIEKLGRHRTSALCYGGKLLNNSEAVHSGIISETVVSDQFEKRAEELLSLWGKIPLQTLREGKKVLESRTQIASTELLNYLVNALNDLKG